MFYKQLLRAQIPKAQKRQSGQPCHFTLLGPMSIKAAHKMLMKLTPEAKFSNGNLALGVNFINILRTAFMLVGPKSVKYHC